MIASFLWSGLTGWEWLCSVVAQTVLGFALIAAILTPLAARIKRWYRRQTNPYSPGGAGDVLAPDGEPMHIYLAERH